MRTGRRARSSEILRAVLGQPGALRMRPAVGLFFLRYMRKFRVRNIDGSIIVHSHLPPLDSAAYGRFIRDHLRGRIDGPSHAQVAVTNACPQSCAFCYNRDRDGRPLDTAEILRVVRELREAGVFWLGLTGGEPLLQKDLVRIVEAGADGCAVKLFTTGTGITADRARDLRRAGLFSVSVSLDSPEEAVHDAGRGFRGAFREALRAIDVFLATPGLDVGVSAVLSREMIRDGGTERFLEFLAGLGVHEAWLSEVKPASAPYWNEDRLITEADRLALARLQDRANRRPGLTVNYLGHFEGRENFGCTAGCKMVYVDAFGEVGPCVFAPMTFGNVRERPLAEILTGMQRGFRPSESCFIRGHYRLLEERASRGLPLDRAASDEVVAAARFGPAGKYFRRYEKPRESRSRSFRHAD